LKIYPDELLSSYIARLAHSLGLVTHTFAINTWGSSSILQNDIDRTIKQDYLDSLKRIYGAAEYSGLEEDVKWLISANKVRVQEPNILNLCIRGRERNKAGQQYCPLCVKEKCYFKKIWRLAFLPVCPEHRCLLINSCPYCHSPIDPLKVSPMLKDIGYCPYCWRNLRVRKVARVEYVPKLIHSLNEAASNKWFEHERLQMYSCLFMEGFWRIVYSIYGTRSRKKEIWRKLCNHYGIEYQELSKSRPYNNFKDETPALRFKILIIVDKLLKHWPKEFVKIGKLYGLGISNFDPAGKGLPYWIDKVVCKELNSGWYRVNIREIESCLSYMQKHNLPITRMGLARELGLDESKKLNHKERELFKKYVKASSVKI
jgi:hypothetical protein